MLTIFRLYRCGDIIRVIILSEIFMAFLNYNKDEKLEFNYKRACGLWLIVIAAIISIATLMGGKQIINMQIFSIGYVISFFSINVGFSANYRRLQFRYASVAIRIVFKRR